MIAEDQTQIVVPKKPASAQLEELKQESKRNSFIIQFEGDEVKTKKKKKPEVKTEVKAEEVILQTEPQDSPKNAA
jgi:hypothetical protein